MKTPHLFLCNGVELDEVDSTNEEYKVHHLSAHGYNSNVTIRIEDVIRSFGQNVTPRLIDLLEIAAYVYAADCATGRGTGWSRGGSTESWARRFKFIIAVSDVEFWQRKEIDELLRRALKFLSNDDYSFEFRQLNRDYNIQGYLDFAEAVKWPFQNAERVLMFSGGSRLLSGCCRYGIKRRESCISKP